ncbi:MAG: hypothetical protein R3E96_10655 [Planctomycetota bacterium]
MQNLSLSAVRGGASLLRRAKSLVTALVALVVSAPLVQAEDPVAVLTHLAPTSTEYILRGTIPVPPGTWDGNRNMPSLAVLNPDGTLAPTQLEVVTRNANQQPEVVEVIARVHRPVDSVPGERVDYPIILRTKAAPAFSRHPALASLMDEPGELMLRTVDVFGNRYEADLLRDLHIGNQRVQKSGALIQQWSGHEVLLPAESANLNSALPHMMGALMYVTTWADKPYMALDLVVHNGMNGLDQERDLDDLLDDIYFRDLTLEFPAGWQVLSMFSNPLESEAGTNSTGTLNLDLSGETGAWGHAPAAPPGTLHAALHPRENGPGRLRSRPGRARPRPPGVRQAPDDPERAGEPLVLVEPGHGLLLPAEVRAARADRLRHDGHGGGPG